MGLIFMKDQKSNNNKQAIIKKKLPYQKPVLINLGDIRDVTMGGSLGSGDSGGSQSECIPGGSC